MSSDQRGRRIVIWATLAVGILGAGWLFLTWSSPSVESLSTSAEQSLVRGEPDRARALAEQALDIDPQFPRALLIAAEAATAQNDHESALSFLRRVSDREQSVYVSARFLAGQLCLDELKQLSAAEREFREVLALEPDHIEANHLLAVTLALGGRMREMVAPQLRLIRSGQVDANIVYLIAVERKFWFPPETATPFLKRTPSDPLPLMTLARKAVDDGEQTRALALLARVLEVYPDLVAAHVLKGEALLAIGTPAEQLAWSKALPAQAAEHSGIWSIRGKSAQARDEANAALRCFWESLRIDPNDAGDCYAFSQGLSRHGASAAAEQFKKRSRTLNAYDGAVDRIKASAFSNLKAMQDAAHEAERLGNLWEAYAWSRCASDRNPQLQWPVEMSDRLQPGLDSLPLVRTAPDRNPAGDLDFSHLQLAEESNPRHSNGSLAVAEIRWRESRLDFTYLNGQRRDALGPERMHEFTGGGCGVLDFDGDGWPDVYLPQGGAGPGANSRQQPPDALFRNRGDGRFENVTRESGLVGTGFGQGVQVGDVNDDGFSDVYVCHAGVNALHLNNGDGTFAVAAWTGDPAWTVSAVLADLNGDTFPDIYDVNYLEGPDVYERVCGTPDRPEPCLPKVFAAAQDRLFLNSGDGTFRDVTTEAGLQHPDGKGLGVVAANLAGSSRLDLFVANDSTENALFVHQDETSDGVPRFKESAQLLGVANNGSGRAEGCMGIAVGDFEGDGLTDLYVTNFSGESNTVYRQRPGGLFDDWTRAAGLHQPSLPWLGFGTQTLDADLDGRLDLLVLNGHINPHDRVFRMPPQFFWNRGGGRFLPGKVETLGPFFATPALGRGLARIDWNRDGRPDAVISHLDTPAALLTNETPAAGRALVVQLVGTLGSRDAIGATVAVTAAEKVQRRQLVAGDGYASSNQRVLIFGLGRSSVVDELRVTWPSGREQRFGRMDGQRHVILVEGRPSSIEVPLPGLAGK